MGSEWVLGTRRDVAHVDLLAIQLCCAVTAASWVHQQIRCWSVGYPIVLCGSRLRLSTQADQIWIGRVSRLCCAVSAANWVPQPIERYSIVSRGSRRQLSTVHTSDSDWFCNKNNFDCVYTQIGFDNSDFTIGSIYRCVLSRGYDMRNSSECGIKGLCRNSSRFRRSWDTLG